VSESLRPETILAGDDLRVIGVGTIASHPIGTPAVMAPVAAVGLLADAISLVGLVAVFAWIAWRFGPTLVRIACWSSWWVAWACGSQGGYGYCVVFLVLGTVAWGAGTVWYARRRGRWPSTLSGRLLARLPGASGAVLGGELRTNVLRGRRQRRTRPRRRD
jgi:hypothetical protein